MSTRRPRRCSDGALRALAAHIGYARRRAWRDGAVQPGTEVALQSAALLAAVHRVLQADVSSPPPESTLVAVPADIAPAIPGLARGAYVHRRAELANGVHDHNCGKALARAAANGSLPAAAIQELRDGKKEGDANRHRAWLPQELVGAETSPPSQPDWPMRVAGLGSWDMRYGDDHAVSCRGYGPRLTLRLRLCSDAAPHRPAMPVGARSIHEVEEAILRARGLRGSAPIFRPKGLVEGVRALPQAPSPTTDATWREERTAAVRYPSGLASWTLPPFRLSFVEVPTYIETYRYIVVQVPSLGAATVPDNVEAPTPPARSSAAAATQGPQAVAAMPTRHMPWKVPRCPDGHELEWYWADGLFECDICHMDIKKMKRVGLCVECDFSICLKERCSDAVTAVGPWQRRKEEPRSALAIPATVEHSTAVEGSRSGHDELREKLRAPVTIGLVADFMKGVRARKEKSRDEVPAVQTENE